MKHRQSAVMEKRMPTKTIRQSVQVDPATYALLAKVKKETGASLSWLICNACARTYKSHL